MPWPNETTPIDDLGFEYFNTLGAPDTAIEQDARTFKEYEYTAGVKDDGTGQQLPPFISFAIKIVMSGTNEAFAPRFRDLQAIALA